MRHLILFILFGLCLNDAHSISSDSTIMDIDELELKTQFMDMNIDCQMLILENLYMKDLNSLLKTNKYFSYFVEDILRRKFSKKMVIFSGLNSAPAPIFDVEETDEYIKVKSAKTAIQLLKKYGRSIRNLRIESVHESKITDQKSMEQVFKLIQEHCTETLTQFHLEYVYANFFEYVTTPFQRVYDVSLLGGFTGFGNDQLNFQQMFPSLRNLYLNYAWNRNISTLAAEYPHLKYLHIDQYSYDHPGSASVPVVMRLIELNPQIEGMELSNVHGNLLKFISNQLPKLKKLIIHNYKDEDDLLIHFEHVKSFKIDNYYHRSGPFSITFGEDLEEFESYSYPQDHKYVDFIKINRNLKKIRIYGEFGVDHIDIQRLALANLNVIEMSLACAPDIKGEHVVKLLENSKYLKRLHLMFFREKRQLIYLREQLQNEWTLNADKRDFYIVRKTRILSH